MRGPWPLRTDLARAELHSYLRAAARTPPDLATRCPPWTVRDLTAHLAQTFRRFAAMLARSRAGDLSPPFAPEDLSAENLRAVTAFEGDPAEALRHAATAFLDGVTTPDEPIAHQLGPIPVGLQVLFALNELAIHHDDLAHAAGRGGRVPPGAVIDALVPVWEARGHGRPDGNLYAWAWILAASGR